MNGKALQGFQFKVLIVSSFFVFFAEWKNLHFQFLDRAFQSRDFLNLVLFQKHLI